MITFPGSVTGASVTGFTTPGYTCTVDTPPDFNAKQVAITALTGTQAGVTAHSVSSPFTLAFFRPKVMATLGKIDQITGLFKSVPKNTYKMVTRKGVTPAANQPAALCVIRVELDIPAGSDTYDAANVKAAISATIGALSTLSASVGDTVINGVL